MREITNKREIINKTALSFTTTDGNKNIAEAFKFKARNENLFTVSDAINSTNDTLYNLIRNNRNNITQKIQTRVT